MSDIVERLRDRDAVMMSGLFHAIPTMAEAAAEIVRLRAALQRIANPVEYFRQYAEEEGHELNGHMAVVIASNAHWLQEEARKALSPQERT